MRQREHLKMIKAAKQSVGERENQTKKEV